MIKPILFLSTVFFVAGCATTDLKRIAFMASSDGKKVCSGLVSAPANGSSVANTASQRCVVTVDNQYTFEDLSVQPADPNASSQFAVVTQLKSSEELHTKSTSKIEVFKHGSRKAKYTFENEDLKQLSSSLGEYPSCFMQVLDINWVGNKELLVDIQPSCASEHTVLNIEMVIDTSTGELSEAPVLTDANTRHYNWSLHPSKSRYNLTIDRANHSVVIDGAEVSGLISGVKKAEAAWVLL